VGTSANSGGVDTAELIEHPVGGSCHSLLMLLGSSGLEKAKTVRYTHSRHAKTWGNV
jgi:hypothetical protein